MERHRDRLSRRQFVVGAGASSAALLAGCGRWPGQAQAPARVPRIGFLAPGSREARAPQIEGLLEGLRELGYADGQNIAIEYRFSEGHDERLPALAAELVDRPVDVIVGSTTLGTLAAQHATSTIPIVMGGTGEPIVTGIIPSLAARWWHMLCGYRHDDEGARFRRGDPTGRPTGSHHGSEPAADGRATGRREQCTSRSGWPCVEATVARPARWSACSWRRIRERSRTWWCGRRA